MDAYRAIAADFDSHSRFDPVIPAKAGIQRVADSAGMPASA